MSTGMSLWQIDETIAQLLELLDDAKPEEIAPIQQELQRYVGETLPAKVDGYIGIILQDETIADAAEAEADRLTKIAKARRARVEWLKNNAKAVMEARGLKRLEGSTGHRLRIQAAGGKQKLNITREDLVPEEICGYHGYISSNAWNTLAHLLGGKHWEAWSGRQDVQMERKPMHEAIRKALEAKCPECGGTGNYSDHEAVGPGGARCAACRGSGRQIVPGAELEPRSVSLRVE